LAEVSALIFVFPAARIGRRVSRGTCLFDFDDAPFYSRDLGAGPEVLIYAAVTREELFL
jgi:hypothetical protein